MADLPPNQKQTVARYAGNRGYFRRPHYWRSLRLLAFVLLAGGSLAVALTWKWWGSEEVFSTGPISLNHARFAHDCRACHLDHTGAARASSRGVPSPAEANGMIRATNVSLMDRACIACHPAKTLHLPQEVGLTLRSHASGMNLVHATACASCHQEHVGHGRMLASDPQRCVDCHADAQTLRATRKALQVDGLSVAASGENRRLPDGQVRFLTPPRPVGTLPAFSTYAQGHPPFAYEGAGRKDPAVLKFNHDRHLQRDIPAVDGQRLECASCHRSGPGQIAFQPVRYEQHCAQCHSLQLQPDLPELTIPHGDAEKVRYFLASLDTSFEIAVRARGLTSPVDVERRVAEERQALQRRGLSTLAELEQRVFLQGDPVEDRADRRPRARSRKFLTECAKCHEVTPGGAARAPVVTPPNLAQRWVQRGPFTHAPHQHVACVACHGAARTSTLTSDILLPPQKLCAECHRPADTVADVAVRSEAAVTYAAAEIQRRTGGVKWDCLSCHGFHAPPDATRIIEKITAAPPVKIAGE